MSEKVMFQNSGRIFCGKCSRIIHASETGCPHCHAVFTSTSAISDEGEETRSSRDYVGQNRNYQRPFWLSARYG